jgi:hypothetical protein
MCLTADMAISSVLRCGACGFKTASIHATRKVKGVDRT